MRRFGFLSGSAGICLLLAFSPAEGGDRPGGIGESVTPAEEALAAQPEPDGYFREMTGFWHGVPGLEALRSRWEGFAAEDAGFAVLAALISESEGKPEEALEKLQGLPGNHARWNEGRLLALLGREGEAVAVLSALVTAAQRPEMGAAALIALTELDCIRGDFTKALQRTTEAWESRMEEGFRLRILERHLSLLVEAGKEKEFLEEQVRLAGLPDQALAGLAEKVMLVMSDWFTEDARLKTVRAKLASSYTTTAVTAVARNQSAGTRQRETMDCGVLWPRLPALEALGQDAGGTFDTAVRIANAMSSRKEWPQNLEGQPLLQRVFREQPLALMRWFFVNPDPAKPLPPLARTLVETIPAGVERRVMDLMERAWAGRAGAEDAEALAAIIVEATQLRQKRPPGFFGGGAVTFWGWPALPALPAREVIWNFTGGDWLKFYRSSCRLAPLLKGGANAPFYDSGGQVISWGRWRPEWPVAREAELMVWAWSQLLKLKEGTPERAAEIAGRMTDPGQRFWFAALIRQKDLLVAWCQDANLLKQVNTAALMEAAQAMKPNDMLPPVEGEEGAVAAIAREMALRLNLNELDMVRSLEAFRRGMTAERKQAMRSRPVDPELAETLGGLSDFSDKAVREHWRKSQLKMMPHPLFGIPVSPSVERFRVLNALLQVASKSRVTGFVSPRKQVVFELFGDKMSPELRPRPPELLEALKPFSSTHPMKRQLARWNELYITFKIKEEGYETQDRRFHEEDPKRDVRLTQALRTLAEEEQASSTWQLVQAALETDEAKRSSLFEKLRVRSPLYAGAGSALTGSAAPPAAPPALPAPRPVPVGPTPAEVAGHFAEILKDPAARKTLEPVGALGQWVDKGGARDAFLHGFSQSALETYPAIASHLMDLVDPLAARLAVVVMSRQSRQGQPVDLEPWLLRALAVFPEDPELLLAFGAWHLRRQDIPEHARAAFVRGLGLVKSMASFDEEYPVGWFGVSSTRLPAEAGLVSALGAMAERVKPDSLPRFWVNTLEETLQNPDELAKMSAAGMQSAALAAVRFKKRWRPGEGSPQGWLNLLQGLVRAGGKEAAAAAAEALLSMPAGSLAYPGGPAEPAPPWHNYSDGDVTSPQSEGWQLLKMATREDPAGLADRLGTLSAAHPGDEQLALAALLAQGQTRPLTADEVKWPGLAPAGRHRVLAYASWLLPPDRLPAALVLESWEAEGLMELSDITNGNRNFMQGIAYMDRLESAGASDAVRRVLTAMVSSVEALGQFPDTPATIFRRVARLGSPPEIERLQRVLVAYLEKMPDEPEAWLPLSHFLQMYLEESGLPETPPELIQRVTHILETAAAGKSPPPSTASRTWSIWPLAYAAAGDPRWHPVLRRLLMLTPDPKDQSTEWQRLSTLMEVLESGRLIPDLALQFSPTEPGEGKLTWHFRGLLPPSRPQAERRNFEPVLLPWPTLAAPLSRAFDALVFASGDRARTGEQLVIRLDSLPARGEISLTNLPSIGRLHFLLIRRDAPQYSAATSPLGYNSLPVLIDTSKPPKADTASPEGWQLLADPIPLGDTAQWYIDTAGPDSMPWPKGMHLVLLDDANHVCASAPISEESRAITWETAGFPGVQLGMNRLAPRAAYSKAEPRLQRTGPPRRLALAISLAQRAGMSAENRPAASLTLREWPAPAAPSTQGCLETLGFWHLSWDGENRTYPPAIADDTSFAAWFTPGKLFLHDLLSQEPPREITLGLPRQTRLDTLFWESGRLVMGYVLPDAKGSNRRYGFASVRPGNPVPVTFGELPSDIRLYPSYDSGIGIGPVFLDSQGYICGVLDPGGKFLPLPPAESGTPPREPLGSYQQLSATTYLCRQEKNGLYPVLDWTDGTLRISSVPKPPAPQIKRRQQWRTDGEGTTGELTGNPPKRWRHPLALNDFRPISEDLVVGVGPEGSLVLFRSIPALETASPPSPDK